MTMEKETGGKVLDVAEVLGRELLKTAENAGRTALKTAAAAGRLAYKGTVKGIDKLGEMDRKDLLKLGCAVACATALPVFIVAPGRTDRKQKEPFKNRNFAHRGLHSRDRSVPENSLKAFELAAEAGYGIELDVQLSKDGQVVVFHDDTLNRVCGVDARVDELDYAELKELRLLDSSETIPLFSEVLTVIRGRGPLIVELKNGRSNKELCEKTCEMLRKYNGEVCIESFNPMIVAWFRFHAKEFLRGVLAAPESEYEGQTSKFTAYLLSRGLLNFVCRPQFIAYKIGRRPAPIRLSLALGAMNVGWTSHEIRNEKGRDAVIFEFYRPKLIYRKRR